MQTYYWLQFKNEKDLTFEHIRVRYYYCDYLRRDVGLGNRKCRWWSFSVSLCCCCRCCHCFSCVLHDWRRWWNSCTGHDHGGIHSSSRDEKELNKCSSSPLQRRRRWRRDSDKRHTSSSSSSSIQIPLIFYYLTVPFSWNTSSKNVKIIIILIVSIETST